MSRCRAWCFTLNNWQPKEAEVLFESKVFRYIIVGKEGKSEDKTAHLQGYCELFAPQRLSYMKKLNARAHWEPRRGTREEARDYCKKEGDWIEEGDFASGGSGTRNDLKRIREACEANSRLRKVAMVCPDICKYVRFYEKIRSEIDQDECPRWRDVKVSVFVGKTGTGKTRKALDHEDYFVLDVTNNSTVWFNGYNRNKRLVIDDFYGWIKFGALLRILDGHPLRLEIKGGFTYAYWTEVIITSNKEWNEWYKELNEEQLNALERRITIIDRFE